MNDLTWQFLLLEFKICVKFDEYLDKRCPSWRWKLIGKYGRNGTSIYTYKGTVLE